MKLKEKIKNLSTKSLLLILGIVIGGATSVFAAYFVSQDMKRNYTSPRAYKAAKAKRVLKPDEVFEIIDKIRLIEENICKKTGERKSCGNNKYQTRVILNCNGSKIYGSWTVCKTPKLGGSKLETDVH